MMKIILTIWCFAILTANASFPQETGGSIPENNSLSKEISWPLKVSSNKRYLVDSKEEPFFVLGDCLWKMHLYSPQEVELIFDNRAQKGFNTMCVATGTEGDLTNYDKEVAFLTDDLSTPNPAYWEHIDFVIDAAFDRDLSVIFNPIWIRNNRERIRKSGKQGCYEYGKWIAKRYISYPNLMFFVGGDHPPREEIEEMNAMAYGLKEIKPDALITYHGVHQHSSRDFFPDAQWLDINWTYSYTPEHRAPNYPYNQGFSEWQDHPNSPLWFGEGYYDWGGVGLKGNDVGRYMMRRQLYWVLLSHIAGYNYGAEGVQDKQDNYYDNGLSWIETLDYPSSFDCQRAINLFKQFKWWNLIPDYENKILVGGFGNYMGEEGDDYALAARAKDGNLVVIYTPVNHDLIVDLGRLSGNIESYWYNPTDGRKTQSENMENKGFHTFSSPGDNGTSTFDWVLILQAR
jgi:hypothetical protein